MEKVQPMLVFVTETHITEEEAFQQFYLPGYRVVSCLSHSRHTGVAVFARNEVVLRVILNKSLEGNWILGISVSRGGSCGKLCCSVPLTEFK